MDSAAEKMVAGVIFLTVGAMVMGITFKACGVGSEEQRENSTSMARRYVSEMHGPTWTRVSCQGVDTDNNGYVSCVVGDGTATEPIECAACMTSSFCFNSGCRPLRFPVPSH